MGAPLSGVDGRGVHVRLPAPPERVVSLVPSTTETLLALGVPVVGCTRFCVRPAEAVADLPRVGGTKDVQPERVRALQPDLIVGNCEENTRAIFDDLAPVAPLWAAFPRDVDGALDDLTALGRLCGVPEAAARWRERIARARDDLHAARDEAGTFSYAALIWRRPWMSASDDTFLAAMLAEAGGTNAFAQAEDRFPRVSVADLAQARPDVVLLLSEPFPFRPRHADELAEATGLPRDRLRFVDGEHLTWHGVRMADAFQALARARREGFATTPTG